MDSTASRMSTAPIEQLPKAVPSFLNPPLIAIQSTVLCISKKTKSPMFRRKNKLKTMAIPNELWLIIFDIVIEEGIITLDQCDYITFTHMGYFFSASARRHPFYNSYYRLRLVCRKFNTLLGARPWENISDSSLIPLPITTRALYIYNLYRFRERHLPHLLAETSRVGRLVSLDIQGEFCPRHFLRECMGRAFPNVRRLILRTIYWPHSPPGASFWTLLHSGFPFLVTLSLEVEFRGETGELELEAEGNELVCFESLEILYLDHKLAYLGCHFPRLRHASIFGCSRQALEILVRSPHLESLLISSTCVPSHIDVTPCKRLKLLGIPDHSSIGVVPLAPDHPVEHIWIYSTSPGSSENPELFKQLSKRLPKISRITVEFLSSDWAHFNHRIDQLQARKIELDSFGLTIRPLTVKRSGFFLLVIERDAVDVVVPEGTLRKVWRRLRR